MVSLSLCEYVHILRGKGKKNKIANLTRTIYYVLCKLLLSKLHAISLCVSKLSYFDQPFQFYLFQFLIKWGFKFSLFSLVYLSSLFFNQNKIRRPRFLLSICMRLPFSLLFYYFSNNIFVLSLFLYNYGSIFYVQFFSKNSYYTTTHTLSSLH